MDEYFNKFSVRELIKKAKDYHDTEKYGLWFFHCSVMIRGEIDPDNLHEKLTRYLKLFIIISDLYMTEMPYFIEWSSNIDMRRIWIDDERDICYNVDCIKDIIVDLNEMKDTIKLIEKNLSDNEGSDMLEDIELKNSTIKMVDVTIKFLLDLKKLHPITREELF